MRAGLYECNVCGLEKLDTFLAFAAKNLGLAPFDEDVERPKHDFGVHAMPFYQRVSPKQADR